MIPFFGGTIANRLHIEPFGNMLFNAIKSTTCNKQYVALFALDEIDFSISDGALDFIVEKAVEYKLGARGLRSLCEAVLTDAMFELPGSSEKEFRVSKTYAVNKLNKSKLQALKAVS